MPVASSIALCSEALTLLMCFVVLGIAVSPASRPFGLLGVATGYPLRSHLGLSRLRCLRFRSIPVVLCAAMAASTLDDLDFAGEQTCNAAISASPEQVPLIVTARVIAFAVILCLALFWIQKAPHIFLVVSMTSVVFYGGGRCSHTR